MIRSITRSHPPLHVPPHSDVNHLELLVMHEHVQLHSEEVGQGHSHDDKACRWRAWGYEFKFLGGLQTPDQFIDIQTFTSNPKLDDSAYELGASAFQSPSDQRTLPCRTENSGPIIKCSPKQITCISTLEHLVVRDG